MELQDALYNLENCFLNKTTEDSIIFEQMMMSLFGQKEIWTTEFLERIEASLVSADAQGCIAGTPGCLEEKKYVPKDLLLSLFRCMLEIYARKSKGLYADFKLYKLREEIGILFTLIRLIQNRENNSTENHVAFMIEQLVNLQQNDALACYHAGYPGHTIYINYFTRSGKLYASICNLGEGLENHERYHNTNGEILVYPVLLEVNDVCEHVTKICQARSYTGKMTVDKNKWLIDLIYSSGRKAGKEDLAEIAQRTANCVIKNYMQAMACRLKNKKDYLDIFDCIRSVLGSHIMNKYDYIYVRDVSHLHQNLSRSQVSYKGASCSALQDIPLHLASITTETVSSPSAIDNTTARIIGGGLFGSAGVYFSFKYLEEKDMPKEQKILIILTVGAICCFLGERCGDAISQPSTSQRTVPGEDVTISAGNVTTCGASLTI